MKYLTQNTDDVSRLEMIPIREISRITGVNAVTLRAWERRYGLLKPSRTDKGHRLYSKTDVQLVQNVQIWLTRGLAISKVREILEENANSAQKFQHENIWHEHLATLNAALQDLNRRKLEKLLSELIALYPTEVIADQLLAPLIESLAGHRYSAITRHEFLMRVLVEQLYARQSRQRQTARGKRVVIFKLTAEESDILPIAFNYSLLINGYQAEYCGYIPTDEWIYAAEQLQAKVVVLYSDSASRLAEVKQSIADWEQLLQSPVLLSGRIVSALPANNTLAPERLLGIELQSILKNLTARFPQPGKGETQ